MNNSNEVKEAALQYAKDSFDVMQEDIKDLRNKPFSFVKESIMDWTALDFEAGANWQKSSNEYDKLKEDNAALLSIAETVKFWFGNEANYPEGTAGNRLYKEAIAAIQKAESK